MDQSEKYDRTVILISVIVIIIVIVISLYLIRGDLFPTSNLRTCPVDQCANNLFTGEKICPQNGQQIKYDPSIQTCQLPKGCGRQSGAPCVFDQKDKGSICPGQLNYETLSEQAESCTALKYCPDFAVVYFEQNTISIPDASACTDFGVLVQRDVWYDQTNLPRNDQPISLGIFGLPNNKICGVPKEQLQFIWPNQCIKGSLILNQVDNLYYCANLPEDFQPCSDSEIATRTPEGQYICQAV